MPTKTKIVNYKAISLFSNCGAGDIGFRKAGFQFEVMAELDPRRLEVCLLNHPYAEGVKDDLRETWTEVVEKYKARCSNEPPFLLSACPPCQGMSSARSNRGKEEDADAGSKDSRNLLVEVIAKVASELKPKLIVVENVPAFLTRKVRHPETNESVSAASLLISRLAEDYEVFPLITDLCDYGVPQTRKRAFLTFVKKDLEGLKQFTETSTIPFPRPTHSDEFNGGISISQALKEMHLPILDAKTSEKAKSNDPLHFVPVWNDWHYSMIAAFRRIQVQVLGRMTNVQSVEKLRLVWRTFCVQNVIRLYYARLLKTKKEIIDLLKGFGLRVTEECRLTNLRQPLQRQAVISEATIQYIHLKIVF